MRKMVEEEEIIWRQHKQLVKCALPPEKDLSNHGIGVRVYHQQKATRAAAWCKGIGVSTVREVWTVKCCSRRPLNECPNGHSPKSFSVPVISHPSNWILDLLWCTV